MRNLADENLFGGLRVNLSAIHTKSEDFFVPLQPKHHSSDLCKLAQYVHGVCLFVHLTLHPPNKLLSAKFLNCFNFQSASILLKVSELLSEFQTAWIWVRPELLCVSSRSKLFTLYGTIVVSGRFRVNSTSVKSQWHPRTRMRQVIVLLHWSVPVADI